jgi:hypothetical protein
MQPGCTSVRTQHKMSCSVYAQTIQATLDIYSEFGTTTEL